MYLKHCLRIKTLLKNIFLRMSNSPFRHQLYICVIKKVDCSSNDVKKVTLK